jgi:hypothetical protein
MARGEIPIAACDNAAQIDPDPDQWVDGATTARRTGAWLNITYFGEKRFGHSSARRRKHENDRGPGSGGCRHAGWTIGGAVWSGRAGAGALVHADSGPGQD